MDAITTDWLRQLAELYPKSAIHLSHQFLSGTDPNPCGFVPNDWDGTRVYIRRPHG